MLLQSFPEVIVDSIDSVLIDNNYHRRIHITESGAEPVSIIEGVGSTAGLLNPLSYFENAGSLECFRINNRTVFPDTNLTCSFITSVKNPESHRFNIFPNPTTGKIYFSGEINNLELYNFPGEKVARFDDLSSSEVIDLNGLSTGLYFYRIYFNNKLVHTGKLVIE